MLKINNKNKYISKVSQIRFESSKAGIRLGEFQFSSLSNPL